MFVILQMLIFSLGKSLQQVVKDAEYEQGNLNSVLESMVRPNPATRASLMDLLDVSTLCLQTTAPSFVFTVRGVRGCSERAYVFGIRVRKKWNFYLIILLSSSTSGIVYVGIFRLIFCFGAGCLCTIPSKVGLCMF
jgi:hypothetical protein